MPLFLFRTFVCFMRIFRVFFVFCSVFVLTSLSAQEPPVSPVWDSLFFLNGEIRAVKITDTAFNQIKFVGRKKLNRKPKTLDAGKDKIFSIKFASGEEKIIYFYDSAIGNVFTVLEAKMFMLGEREADKNYKSRWPFVMGFAVGAVSPIVFSNAVMLSPIPAAAAPLGIYIPKIKVNTKVIAEKNYLQYDTYLMGYEKVARKKNFIQALIGAGTGLAAGFGAWALIK